MKSHIFVAYTQSLENRAC